METAYHRDPPPDGLGELGLTPQSQGSPTPIMTLRRAALPHSARIRSTYEEGRQRKWRSWCSNFPSYLVLVSHRPDLDLAGDK